MLREKIAFGFACQLIVWLLVFLFPIASWAEEGAQKWACETGGYVYSSPVIGADGIIYVGSRDFKFYAIDPDGTVNPDGTIPPKWTFRTDNRVYSSPAVGADGTIYVGSHDFRLYAINPNGTKKWEFVTGSWVESSPAIGSDGTIYVGSWDEYLYAVNPEGTEKWAFKTGGYVKSCPAIGSDGTIYVGSDDHYLYAINPDGTQKWAFETENRVRSSPAIGADGTIYVGSDDCNLYAINPSGTKKWEFATGGFVYSSPAIGSDGTIYVGSDDKKVYAIDPMNGAKKWEFTTGGLVYSSPAIGADGTIYVGSNDYRLYAISSDGDATGTFETGGYVWSSPVIGDDGTVYVGSGDQNFYAVSWIPDTTPPTVNSTSPANSATDVGVNTVISATFSEVIAPPTITIATFLVSNGTSNIAGTVNCSGATASFLPTEALEYDTVYTGTITTGAKDLAGNALESDYTWSFTTGTAPDTTPPTVSSTSPENNATDVGLSAAISATFSEAMNPATVTTATLIVNDGTNNIAGTVACSGTTAMFTPTATLDYDTVYTATITTEVEDLAGNAVETDYVWSFSTIADTTSPTVSSTSPANSAIDVAVNTAISATFSENMDPLTITTATFFVNDGTTNITGTVDYSSTTATFRPDSDLDYDTDYTATITTGAEDLAGNGLEVDYTWSFTTGPALDTTAPTVSSTSPANDATDVAVNTAISATFSEAMDPLTITAATFLVNDATGYIAGTVAYSGTTAMFTPTTVLDYDTDYTATITTGARDLAGNALEGDYTWSFTTGPAPDTTAPTVSSTSPANSATDVAVNTAISATFSENMDPLTITTATFFVNDGTTNITGTVDYSSTTATFRPSSDFDYDTDYTATITTGAEDLAGNGLEVDYTWSFTTGPVPDTTAPTVSFTSPANDATDVAVNTAISATFSEAMDPLTITTVTLVVNDGTTNIIGTVDYSGTTATFRPSSDLDYDTDYTATITTGARDLAGNALEGDYTWSFTTGPAPDTTAPTVSSTSPANNATDVAVNTAISVTFSESMDASTITTATFFVNDGTTNITGAVDYSSTTATFRPDSDLDYDTDYTATITTGAEDLAGNALEPNYSWLFTTRPTPSTDNLTSDQGGGESGGGGGGCFISTAAHHSHIDTDSVIFKGWKDARYFACTLFHIVVRTFYECSPQSKQLITKKN